jgi:hypothetical protein
MINGAEASGSGTAASGVAAARAGALRGAECPYPDSGLFASEQAQALIEERVGGRPGGAALARLLLFPDYALGLRNGSR